MAWLDDRLWCHPKVASVSVAARWTYAASIMYSSGFQTRGLLTAGQQKAIGSTTKIRRELIAVGLWDEEDHDVRVHDWDEHNSRRDAKRTYDRERKRRERDRDPDSWVIRSGQWQKTRQQVFARDKGICVDCGKYHGQWHADHVPSRAVLRERGEDFFDIQFIQTRCPRCHSRRHINERTAHGQNPRTDSPTDGGQAGGRSQAEGSEGSEGRTSTNPEAVTQDATETTTAQVHNINDITPTLRGIA